MDGLNEGNWEVLAASYMVIVGSLFEAIVYEIDMGANFAIHQQWWERQHLPRPHIIFTEIEN